MTQFYSSSCRDAFPRTIKNYTLQRHYCCQLNHRVWSRSCYVSWSIKWFNTTVPGRGAIKKNHAATARTLLLSSQSPYFIMQLHIRLSLMWCIAAATSNIRSLSFSDCWKIVKEWYLLKIEHNVACSFWIMCAHFGNTTLYESGDSEL